jgi:hypothetical protein
MRRRRTRRRKNTIFEKLMNIVGFTTYEYNTFTGMHSAA